MAYYDEMSFSDLLGQTITSFYAEEGGDTVTLTTREGNKYELYHSQDCCESVYLQDIIGDMNDLVGTPLTMAEEESNSDNPPSEYTESHTWTFYKLATVKGYVTLRWLGESNGYYSEGVHFRKVE